MGCREFLSGGRVKGSVMPGIWKVEVEVEMEMEVVAQPKTRQQCGPQQQGTIVRTTRMWARN